MLTDRSSYNLVYAEKERAAKEKVGDNDNTVLNWVLKIELDSMYNEVKCLTKRQLELKRRLRVKEKAIELIGAQCRYQRNRLLEKQMRLRAEVVELEKEKQSRVARTETEVIVEQKKCAAD